MKKILFVSHCILNTASKVVLYNQEEIMAEENLRQEFLNKAIQNGIQLIQLPCPEFTLYGARRWGHTSNQFDNIFFRNHCRNILVPVIQQLQEYLNQSDFFDVIGIVGIDGSPSCGVDYTCYGDWYGAFDQKADLEETLKSCHLGRGNGIFIDVLKEMLEEHQLSDKIKISSLFALEPDKCLAMAEGNPPM